MTSPDFAELKEKLVRFDENKFKEWSDDYRVAYSFWPSIKESVLWQHTKSAAIITELLEIIQSQSEVIKEFYKTAQRIDKFGYGVNIESKGIISNTEEILVNTCANAIEVITETNTRLQKLRDGTK